VCVVAKVALYEKRDGLGTAIGAGSVEDTLAVLGAIFYNPLAFSSDSLPLFPGYINYYNSVNVPSKLVVDKIYIGIFCLLFTWPEVCPGTLTRLLHRP
jgi:hypothetical protein